MKKKILLGSIFAVTILIFLSFNNVVGYQNDNPFFVDKSPLFSVRINRAIEQVNNLCSSDYIGKGKNTGLSFPTRSKNSITINKMISWITNMDKTSYTNFNTFLVSRLNNEKKLSETQIQKILNTLSQIRNKPELMMNYFGNNNNYYDRNSDDYTLFNDCTYQLWFPGCFLYYIFWIINIINLILFSFLRPTCINYDTCGWTCSGPSWCLIGCGIE